MGGGGTKSSSSGGTPKAIIDMLTNTAQEASPLRRQLLTQTEEALRTGGVGANIPSIQRAVEGTNRATGQSLRGANESLSMQGLSGTPFAARTLADIGMQGRQQASNLPVQMASQLSGLAPQLSQGILGLIAGLTRTSARSTEGHGGLYTS